MHRRAYVSARSELAWPSESSLVCPCIVCVVEQCASLQIDVNATLREPDGLAMSSRNVYLTPEQRRAAPALYKALSWVQDEINNSEDGRRRLATAREARKRRSSNQAMRRLLSLIHSHSTP
jgi:pantothenate synthetase